MPIPDPETFHRELSERIQSERLKRKYTLEQLGNRLGLSRATINNLEKGRHRPSIYQLIQIAEFFNMKYTDLVPFDDKPKKIQVEKVLAAQTEIDKAVSDTIIDKSVNDVLLSFLTTINKK